MPGRHWLPLGSIALLLAAAACAHRTPLDGAPAPDADAGAALSDSVELEVENHNWLDVALYVLHDGMQDRVGMATGSSTSTLVLPARLVGQGGVLQFVAHAVGARSHVVTEQVSVGPLRHVVWTLESDLARSSVASW